MAEVYIQWRHGLGVPDEKYEGDGRPLSKTHHLDWGYPGIRRDARGITRNPDHEWEIITGGAGRCYLLVDGEPPRATRTARSDRELYEYLALL